MFIHPMSTRSIRKQAIKNYDLEWQINEMIYKFISMVRQK